MSDSGLRVGEALAAARERGVARLDAHLMLARLMGVPRTWLIGHDDALIDAPVRERWLEWLERRAAGEPLAYLLEEKEFRGLLLRVTLAVLVPRPETELLVDWAGELLRAGSGRIDALDLGTGSGAIAIAVKHEQPHARVVATDASRGALAVAQANAKRLMLEIEFLEASWWAGLEARQFDVVLANPPYVAGDDIALQALRHEPRLALTPGGDGLGAIAAIVDGAAAHLRRDGWLVLEHGFEQAQAVRELLGSAGFVDLQTRADLAGHARATGGRVAAAPA